MGQKFFQRNSGHDKDPECPPDGKTSRGVCLGGCSECGEHLLCTGRYTPYCPSCQTCPTCGCPEADGFSHYAGCDEAEEADDDDADAA